MIVSSDGKFPSVIRKPNLTDAFVKDKAKFDTQNPTIGTLLTQIDASKLNQEKQIKKQLETSPSIKDLKIAKLLKGLRNFNRRRVDDNDNNDDKDDDDGHGPRPPRTPPSPPYHFLLYNTPLPSPPISDDNETERMPGAGEKVAIAEKVKFSEKLSKVFSEANEILNKNDHQKPLLDDAESLSKPDEMTIPHKRK